LRQGRPKGQIVSNPLITERSTRAGRRPCVWLFVLMCQLVPFNAAVETTIGIAVNPNGFPMGRVWAQAAAESPQQAEPLRPAPSSEDLEWFEDKVRPALIQHCGDCHGAEDFKGGLRLDQSAGWLVGGDSGPAVIPHDPDQSLLIQAIRYTHPDVQMPPDGRLPEATIAILEDWVRRGAPAPESDPAAVRREGTAIDWETARQFWAYRPLSNPRVPEIPSARTDVDAFIEQALQTAGLTANERASKDVLLRRLTFDLWGLPPTVEQRQQFLADDRPDAVERLVETLLASPRFAERFARRWFDLVRYAESLTLRGFLLPDAWRYRDFIIDSFHRDRPYDEFVRLQIAGDLIPAEALEQRQRHHAAVTFLMLGNTNLEEQDKQQLDMDVVDEQLDTLGKVFLGQSLGCARCHDHKFDPIPTADYYALAGILKNVQVLKHSNVSELVLADWPLPAEEAHEFAQRAAAMTAVSADIQRLRRQREALQQGGVPAAPAIVALDQLPGVIVDDAQARQVGQWQHSQHSQRYIGDGYLHDQNDGKGSKTLSFIPRLPQDGRYEVRLAYIAGSSRSSAVSVTVFSADGERTILVNQQQTPPLQGRFVSLGEYQFEVEGQSFVIISNENSPGHVTADAVQFLPVTAANNSQAAANTPGAGNLTASGSTTSQSLQTPSTAEKSGTGTGTATENAPSAMELIDRQLAAAEESLKQLQLLPRRPTSLSPLERQKIENCRIHIRGSVNTLGPEVPRGFLRVVDGVATSPLPSDQSGRRQLAEWLTAPTQPLTPRVYVNRVWSWLFGAGLVRTVDAFNHTGEPPSHPELLDDLATRFVQEGWSTKQLVRQLVLTDAYQRSSLPSAEALALDPENRLLWRMNRRRLEAEELRDALLQISGRLTHHDPGQLGSTIPADLKSDFAYRETETVRSVYLPIFRNALPALFEVFDFADPSLVVGQRNTSTVAPQALYLMNHPFVQQQAESSAQRLLQVSPSDSTETRLTLAAVWCWGREPTTAERQLLLPVVTGPWPDAAAELSAWRNLFHLCYSAIDFRYRD
jgi:hypothetical protein